MFGVPPPNRSNQVPTWNWVKLPKGKSCRGWLAGPIVGVMCHHFGGTRACAAMLTGGKVACGHDHDRFPPEWKGYVPFWSEEGVRSFVVIMDAWYDLAAKVPHLGELLVTKTEFHGSPIRVNSREWAAKEPPITAHEKRPQDIRPYLLRLWKNPDLKAHFAKHPFPKQEEPGAMTRAAFVRAEVTEEVLKRTGKRDNVEPVGQVLDKILKNGKH